MANKIAHASTASCNIVSAMDRASWALHTGSRPYNGYGVLADPSLMLGKLREAKAAIDGAMTLYGATSWPSREDYEAAEAHQ